MKDPSPVPPSLSNEDVAVALDWLDGELSPEGGTAFELRLAGDPELARHVEALAGLDTLMRRQARAGAEAGVREPQPWASRLLLAAAGLIAALVLWRTLTPPESSFEVALAPSFASAEDWVQSQATLADKRAPGIAVVRGDQPTTVSAADFLVASAEAENAVTAEALAAKRRELEAGWFVVPIDLWRASRVLVLSFPERGAGSRLFPEPTRDDPTVIPELLGPGRHILPSSRAKRGRAQDTVDYVPGFLVPIGARQLQVLVAVREFGAGPPPLEELDSRLAAAESFRQIAAYLQDQGFQVQQLTVLEPK